MRRSTLTSFAALLLVAGLTAGCGSSKQAARSQPQGHSSAIVFDRRIGPVTWREPQAQITKALGRGIAGYRVDGDMFTAYPHSGLYVAYTQPPAVIVNYHHPPKVKPPIAIHILTRSAQYRIDGVGVGSSFRQLQQQVPVVCIDTERNVETGNSVTYHSAPTQCQHGNPTGDHPVTVFKLDTRTRRVTEVEIVYGECSVTPGMSTLTVCGSG